METSDDRVRLVSMSRGAELEIDLSRFAEPAPSFAYVDDGGAGVEVLHGLEVAGRIVIADRQDFMWLHGPRDCVLMRATADGASPRTASFRSCGIGEFCLEIYYVRPDSSVELLAQCDFCFK